LQPLESSTKNASVIAFQLEEQIGMLRQLLLDIPEEDYARPLELIGQSSIGQHTRHIIELLQVLHNGFENSMINYADRKRDVLLENNPQLAVEALDQFNSLLALADKNLNLVVEDNEGVKTLINTTFYRELLHNTEHAIHHMALIKVALRILQRDITHPNFGMAYATIQHKKNQCAR
jgi:DinB superfamily